MCAELIKHIGLLLKPIIAQPPWNFKGQFYKRGFPWMTHKGIFLVDQAH
jgi:hypothetical protein